MELAVAAIVALVIGLALGWFLGSRPVVEWRRQAETREREAREQADAHEREYRELDDELRNEIREKLLEQRIGEAIDEKITGGLSFLQSHFE